MKKTLLCCLLLLLTTVLMAQEATSTESEATPKEKKIPVALGIQGSYLFHMYNDNLYADLGGQPNMEQFNHGGVGLNLTIGSAQKFHAVIYGGISFYQGVDTSRFNGDSKNDQIGGKFTVDLIPINIKLGKKSLSTFYAGIGIGFDTVFDSYNYYPDGAYGYAYNDVLFYGALNFRVPVGLAIRASEVLEFYVQNAFQFGVEFTGMSGDFAITSDLEFGLKFWIQ